jgi:hypothetical protein
MEFHVDISKALCDASSAQISILKNNTGQLLKDYAG